MLQNSTSPTDSKVTGNFHQENQRITLMNIFVLIRANVSLRSTSR